MRDLSITIIELLAVLIPGFLLLLGLVLLFLVLSSCDFSFEFSQMSSHPISHVSIINNHFDISISIQLLLILTLIPISYVLGFISRLISQILLNGWNKLCCRYLINLKPKAELLEKPFRRLIRDYHLTEAVTDESKKYKGDIDEVAPLFYYAKAMILRVDSYQLQSQRLEAEGRLSAALLLPFLVFWLNGILLINTRFIIALLLILAIILLIPCKRWEPGSAEKNKNVKSTKCRIANLGIKCIFPILAYLLGLVVLMIKCEPLGILLCSISHVAIICSLDNNYNLIRREIIQTYHMALALLRSEQAKRG